MTHLPHSERPGAPPGNEPDVRSAGTPAVRERWDVADLHRLLVEQVQDYAIFVLDPEGRILSWNRGAERLKGYAAEEIIGRHFSVFYPPEDRAANVTGWELEVAAKEGRFEDEGWRVRKDGSRFWANVVITALFDHEGHHAGFGKVTRDVTERMNTHAELDIPVGVVVVEAWSDEVGITEFRALAHLPAIGAARLFEPMPEEIHSWRV